MSSIALTCNMFSLSQRTYSSIAAHQNIGLKAKLSKGVRLVLWIRKNRVSLEICVWGQQSESEEDLIDESRKDV